MLGKKDRVIGGGLEREHFGDVDSVLQPPALLLPSMLFTFSLRIK